MFLRWSYQLGGQVGWYLCLEQSEKLFLVFSQYNLLHLTKSLKQKMHFDHNNGHE